MPVCGEKSANKLHATAARTGHRQGTAMRANEVAAQGEGGAEEMAEVEDEVDRAAAELWGISEQELGAIKEALAEL